MSHHQEGRGLEALLYGLAGDILYGGDHGPVHAGGAPANQGCRGLRVHAGLDEAVADVLQVLDPHEKDQGAGAGGQAGPVVGAFRLVRVFVSGDKRDRRSVSAVSQGDSGVGRGSHGRGHSGNDLKVYARLKEFLGFFGPAPEYIRVAAFEPGYMVAAAGPVHQELVDAFLAQGMIAAFLAHVDKFCILSAEFQKGLVGQIVVDHHVGPGQKVPGPQCQKPGITWTGTYEIYFAHILFFLL